MSPDSISQIVKNLSYLGGEVEGSVVMPAPFPDTNGIAGTAGGASKSKAGLAVAPKSLFSGVAGGAGKGKAGLGLAPGLAASPHNTVPGLAGGVGKSKAALGLVPGLAVVPKGVVKSLLSGKAIVGAGAILPGVIGFVGPTGLLPSVTAFGAGFGSGILLPLLIAGLLMEAARPAKSKPRANSNTAPFTDDHGDSVDKPATAQNSATPPTGKPAKSRLWAGVTVPTVAYKANIKTDYGQRQKPERTRSQSPQATPAQTAKDNKTVKGGSNPLPFDRRFALRIKVPREAMIVQGVLNNGQLFQSYARDVSMHGVRFDPPKQKINKVQKLFFPKHNITLTISEFRLHRQTADHAVAVLSSFENGPGDWMKWIELITRLD